MAWWIFLKSTLSLTVTVTDLAFLLLLAYSPILSFLFWSSLLTCLSALFGLLLDSTDGKSLRGVWRNISCAGGTLVMVCGVAVYCSRNFSISCCQSFPSAWEHCMAFPNVLLKRSTSPLAEGQQSVTTGSLMLCWIRKVLIDIDLNWDSLSVVMHLGYVKVVKILSRVLMMVFAVVVFNTDMNGKLDR